MKKFAIACDTFTPSGYDSKNGTWFNAERLKMLTNNCLHQCMGELMTNHINIESVTTTTIPVMGIEGHIYQIAVTVTMIASVEYERRPAPVLLEGEA